uniref:Peptidase S1 domain-containing protein n=1 Tax=Lepeophtheirus salmonis TaxID=72036 RepID=A0A0K2UG34_LEPSM
MSNKVIKLLLYIAQLPFCYQLFPLDCNCGRSYAHNGFSGDNSKMLKGDYLSKNEQPWLSFLDSSFSDGRRIFCSGAIINLKFIITAAHCLKSRNHSLDLVYVYVGAHNLSNMDKHSRIYRSSSVILHEDYNERTFENDIGLVELPVSLLFSPSVQPVCLPRHREVQFNQRIATVYGWGDIQHNRALGSLLPKGVNLYITQPDEKRSNGSLKRFIAKSEENRVCTLSEGGPLVLKENRKFTLVGVTSLASQCEVQNMTGEFARVSQYMGWIIKHAVNGECFRKTSFYSRILTMLRSSLT